METNLIRVLEGQYLDELTSELCDFSLEEQNAATEAQGVKPLASSDYVPVVGKSVTYVVACIIVNDKNEVLMMQEAKESCAGKWYLPAGRMEPGETIMEAGAREVLEETGLKVDITTLLGVESAGADQESIQAKWIDNLNELNLRANDILPIIDLARNHRRRLPKDPSWHRDILPAKKAHYKNYLRIVVAIKNKTSQQVYVLLSEKTAYHFPTVEIHPGRSLHSTLKKFMIELFGADLPQHRPHGVLSVEHHSTNSQPNPTDGICITLLVICRPSIESVSLIGKCIWHELNKELSARLAMTVAAKNSTLLLHVVR
ncbi:hypothetical protein quinque_007158 [Culex quinquefasciatus]